MVLHPLHLQNHVIQVEIADTPATRTRGLMYRTSLPPNRGMLFDFKQPTYSGFWMKNTNIPLDIGFFDKNHQLLEIHQLTPYSLKSVKPAKPYYTALEVNQGWFKQHNIKLNSKYILSHCNGSLGHYTP